MPIVVRFVSGSLSEREFSFPKETVRIGDGDGVDLRVDPAQAGDGGARGRVIEISVEGAGFRVRSAGNRELSAQGEAPLDHPVADGGEVRFGAWGPIFTVRGVFAETSRTAPVPVFDDSATRRPDEVARRGADETASRRRSVLTASGEKPIGPKTVMVMIQDALSKAREQGDAGFVEKGTVFVREVVADTITSATRSLKIGLVLTGAALVILAFALGYNVWRTRETVARVTRAADESVQGVRKELGTRVEEMRKERDALAAESAEPGNSQLVFDAARQTYQRGGGTQAETRSMLLRLIDFLKEKQITALMTTLTGGAAAQEETEVNISSLVDTWLLLRDIEEMSTEETARVLGLSENAVKVRLHRARQALRTLLDPLFQ